MARSNVFFLYPGSCSRDSRALQALRITALCAAALAMAPARAQLADAGTPPESVIVEGRREPAQVQPGTVGEFSGAPLAQTPVSVDVIDANAILDRGINSLSSLLRETTSAVDDYNAFGYVESARIRGFSLDSLLNFRRDGLPFTNHVPVALENKEAVQVYNGVPGEFAADAAPGGLINFALKRPTDQALRSLSAEVSERGSQHYAADFGGRFDDGRFGYRINAALEDRHPAIDRAWSRRNFGSGFFDWRLAGGSKVELEFEYQGVQEISVPGFGLVDATRSGVATVLPPAFDPRINLNTQPWSQPFQSREASGSLGWTGTFGDSGRFGLRIAEQRSVTNDRLAFPDGCNNPTFPNYTTVSFPGVASVYPGMCLINGRYYMDMNEYISDNERRDTQVLDAYASGRLSALGLEHEWRAGLRSTRYTERYPPYQTYNNLGAIDIFAPAALPGAPDAATANADMDLHLHELSLFDVVRFASRWSAWLGVRASRLSQDSHLDALDPTTNSFQATSLQQDFVTPFASLAFAPSEGSLAYLSYVEGAQIEQVPSRPDLFSNPGQVLPALRSRQFELGYKLAGRDGQGLNAALFQIDKPFSDDLGPDATTGLSQRIAGARHARHRGVELSGNWVPVTGWRLLAKANWLDAFVTESLNPSWVDRATTNVPHLHGQARIAWQPARIAGLEMDTTFSYSGHKPVLPDGSVALPDAWQWDASARYSRRIGSGNWTWRAGVDNLTNRTYWREAPTASWGAQYLFAAQPRTFRASAQVQF